MWFVCDMADELDRRAADTDAVDMIAEVLSGAEWSPDTLDIIAGIVRGVGRDVDGVADGEAVFTVWVGGGEVNDHYLTRGQAETLAAEWRAKGHDDVAVTYGGAGCDGWGASCDAATVQPVTYVHEGEEVGGRFCVACRDILAASGAVVDNVGG